MTFAANDRLRASWRLARVLLQVLQGLLICAFIFPWLGPGQRMQRVALWCRGTLRALDVGLHSHGTLHAGPVLLVANHISWLDILVINAVHPVRFVSKADVRGWPLLGWMVACGGTLFIERERKRDAMRVVHQVADALAAGGALAIFPEGTTSDGHGLLPFHANLLQAAIASQAPVQPVALRYGDALGPVSSAAAFVGDTTLVQSLWRTAAARRLVAQVDFLPAEASRGAERRALAQRVRSAIQAHLGAGDATPA